MTRLPDFANEHCSPRKSRDVLTATQVKASLAAVPGWNLSTNGKKLPRRWIVKDFLTALDYFRRIARIAQSEDHHPDLHVRGYRNVTIELWTHSAGGVTRNDFILAAKIDRLPIALKKHRRKA